jgi:hypothetical protein
VYIVFLIIVYFLLLFFFKPEEDQWLYSYLWYLGKIRGADRGPEKKKEKELEV